MAGKYDHINFKPPKSVADAAKRGLELRKKNKGRGGLSAGQAKKEGVGSGVQRAVNLKNRSTLSPSTVRRMKAFFDRHQKSRKIDKGKTPGEDRGYIAWCLKGDTEILLEDGSFLPISKIVDEKMRISVLTYNEKNGNIEPKLISGWSRAPATADDFCIIGRTYPSFKTAFTSKTFVAATKEHPFYSNKKWISADNMENETINLIDKGLDSVAEQVLFGTILGDSCLRISSGETSNLRNSHCEMQKEYLLEKSALLSVLGTKVVEGKVAKSGFGKGCKYNYLYSNSSLYLNKIREMFYKNGKKVVTKKVLSKLNDIAVAFWIMDDGKLKYSKRDGYGSWSLHTEGFDKRSVDNIVEFLNSRYNINARCHKRENADGFYIYFTNAGTRKVMSKIAKYFPLSMRYKLYPEFRDVVYALKNYTPKIKNVLCEVNVDRFGMAKDIYNSYAALKPYKWKWRYNLEIEDNHNFFANGILTHNCLWGGDPGYSWAKKVVRQMESADKKKTAAVGIPRWEWNKLKEMIEDGASFEEANKELGTTRENYDEMKRILEADADDPCWKNYKQVGWKDKDGKKVPMCVPKESNLKIMKMLVSLANELDEQGLYKEAQEIDAVVNTAIGQFSVPVANVLNNLSQMKMTTIPEYEKRVKEFKLAIDSREHVKILESCKVMVQYINDKIQIALGPTGSVGDLQKDFGQIKELAERYIMDSERIEAQQEQEVQQETA